MDNSRCIFRVFSYLGLISFIFTAAGVLAWVFNFFSLCVVVFAKTYFTFLPSRAPNRQIHSEYFFFIFIHKVTWYIKVESRKCSDVKDLTCLPSRVSNRQIHSEYFNHCLTKQIEIILPLYLLKEIFLETTNKRYYLFSQCSK